jgi:tRNA uridine 5-carboxymethylaminomethyl modification enzyme
LDDLVKNSPAFQRLLLDPVGLDNSIKEQIEIEVKYEGYIKRQLEEIERAKRMENYRLPPNIDYEIITHLSKEARTQLNKFKPISLGQASRIAGVSLSDISVLMIYFGKGSQARL